MMRMQRSRLRIVAAGMTASLALVPTALTGSSFRLDIGHPIAGSGTPKFKKAVLLVRGLACDDPASIRMTGSAEGIVNGARQSLVLQLAATGTPGVFAVPQPPAGQWVLNLTGTCPGRQATASAVVPLGGPSGFIRDKAEFYDGPASPAHVNASLSSHVLGAKR